MDYSVQRTKLSIELPSKPKNLKQAQHELRQSQRALKEVITQAKDHRERHLEDRLQCAQCTGQEAKAKIVAKIKSVENLKSIYRKLRFITNGISDKK